MMDDALPIMLDAFDIPQKDSTFQKLQAGKINNTWLVTTAGQRYVLQRVNDAFRAGMIEDCARVLEQLRLDGWDVPHLIATRSGHYSYEHNGKWRLSTFIDSDMSSPSVTSSFLHACGELLARLHRSMAKIDSATILPFLPHYRDTQFHIDHLKTVLPRLESKALTLAQAVVTTFEDQKLQIPPIKPQLIHADPKMSNILFRGGQPYTYIDWDTVMPGSPLIDLGDFVRSLRKESQDAEFDSLLQAFCRGYYETNDLDFSHFDDFSLAVRNAAKTITIDNAARYLYSIADQSLWEWDQTTYATREEAMIDETRKAWRIFELLDT